MIKIEEYLYVVNYPKFEEEICRMEMDALFGVEFLDKMFFSNREFNPSNSAFIKNRIDIIYKEDTLEKILENIKNDKLAFDDFKVEYIKLESGNVPYEMRLDSVRKIGYIIEGFPDIHNPKISLGITKVCNQWILGINRRNDYEWHIHDRKPCTYSNSLSIRVARTLINIATKGDRKIKIIDPCCGVGTVLIEGLSMGYDIFGCEINPQICANAKRNLEFFGLEKNVYKGSMHDLKEEYDVSIIDIPYGVFTKTTKEEQMAIIESGRRLSDKMIIITFEDMSEMIQSAGFTIEKTCKVSKGQFVRYISICN